jgi:hypothetical protein
MVRRDRLLAHAPFESVGHCYYTARDCCRLAGASIVFGFIVKFLLTHDQALDPADYDRVGVVGRVSSAIRQGGTGEIIFSQEGVRQTCGARCEDGEALPHGTEVIVTRYEHGIAYVRRYEEMADSPVSRHLDDNSQT